MQCFVVAAQVVLHACGANLKFTILLKEMGDRVHRKIALSMNTFIRHNKQTLKDEKSFKK